MTLVWIYAVVSFYTQAETLESQRARLIAKANESGWAWRVFGDQDSDGVSSGKDGPRKLLLTLLDALRNTPRSERPAYVLMTRQDRIGRGRLVDTAVVLRDIYDLGAKIYTLEDGELRLDDPMDELVAMVKQASASQENRNRIDKARQGHARRKARGLHDGHPPYGITLQDGKPVPQEPQASIVRTLFAMRAQGLGLHTLAQYAKDHAPPKRMKTGLKVLRWSKATVQMLLRCRTYRDVVISAGQFDAVAGIKKPGLYPISSEGVWPLRGSVSCFCGRRLSGRMSGHARWRRRYYVCSNHFGRTQYFQADRLEHAFTVFLLRLRTHPDLTYSADEQTALIAHAKFRVTEIRRQLRTAAASQAKAWEIAESGEIPPEALKARLKQHDETIARLTAQLAEAEADIVRSGELSSVTQTILQLLESLSPTWPKYTTGEQSHLAGLIAQATHGLQLTKDSSSQEMTIDCGLDHPQSERVCLQFSPLWERISAAL